MGENGCVCVCVCACVSVGEGRGVPTQNTSSFDLY